MLRVNVGLSRKVSRDYNSTGFSTNIDGEVTAPVSDAEAVIEQVKQLYDLAEEALDVEISRYQGAGGECSSTWRTTSVSGAANCSASPGSR